jgi:hypothetical protein
MRKLGVLALAPGLAGCAIRYTLPVMWTRADGKAEDPTQRQIAETVCRGEVQKTAAQGGSVGTLDRQDVRAIWNNEPGESVGLGNYPQRAAKSSPHLWT